MNKSKPITIADAKKIDDRIAKDYPQKKPFPLAKVLSSSVKKKSAKKKR